MSTGPRTQATFAQGNQSTVEQDGSHSALFYLFQEVSRLASPVHSSFLETDSPSEWRDETSRLDRFNTKKEDDDACLFQTFDSSCQHSLSGMLNYNQINRVREESRSSKIRTLMEPHCECNSPWKVLSLINLQCEKLLDRRHVEESDQSSVSSTTKLGHQVAKTATAAADVTEQVVRIESLNVEYTLRPSLLNYRRQEITASVSHVEDVRGHNGREACNYKPQCCVKDIKVGCSIKPQKAETTDTVISELVEENATASSQPQHMDKREVRVNVKRQLD